MIVVSYLAIIESQNVHLLLIYSNIIVPQKSVKKEITETTEDANKPTKSNHSGRYINFENER